MEDFLAFGPEVAPSAPAPAVAGAKRRRSPSPEVALVRAGSRAVGANLSSLPPASAIPWHSPIGGHHKSLPGSCALLRLHEEVLDFARFMSPTPSEQEYADGALMRIADAVKHLYPDARVEVFGSRANGLVLPTSDWDIVLFGVPSGSFTMHRIAAEVARRGLSSKTEVIDSARIPIVKIRDKTSGIMVDVSFAAASGLVTRALINDLITRYPAVRPLVLVLKYFLIQRGLNETYTGGIGSYMLVLMVVHVVQSRMADAGCFDEVAAGRTSSSAAPRQRSDLNLGSLLLSFLELYGHNLNYFTTGISVRGTGGGCYFAKRKRGWFDGNRPWLLSIESPVDPTADVGKNSWAMQRVRRAFQHAHMQLSRAIRKYAGDDVLSRGSRPRLPTSLLEQVIPVDTLLRMRAAELASDGQGIPCLRSAGSSGAASASAATPSGVGHGDDSDDDPERELPQAGESGSDSEEAAAAPAPDAATPATPAAAADAAAAPLSVEAARAAALEKLGRSGIVLRHSRLLADVLTRGVRGVQAAADECAKEGRWF